MWEEGGIRTEPAGAGGSGMKKSVTGRLLHCTMTVKPVTLELCITVSVKSRELARDTDRSIKNIRIAIFKHWPMVSSFDSENN